MKTALRWIAVLPAAFAASFLAVIAYLLLAMLFAQHEPAWWIRIVASGISGAAFVYAGWYVAPSHKTNTALGLAGLALLLALAAFWSAAVEGGSFWAAIVKNAPFAVASAATWMHLRDEYPERDR